MTGSWSGSVRIAPVIKTVTLSREVFQAAARTASENPVGAAIEGVQSPIRLSLNTLRRHNRAKGQIETDRLMFRRSRGRDVLDVVTDGPLMREAFEMADFSAEMARRPGGWNG